MKNLIHGGKEGAEVSRRAAKGSSAAAAGGGLSWLPGSFAQQPVIKQMKTLGGIFVLLLLGIAILVVFNNRSSTHGTAYVAASGEMRMLSQRLAKASTLALQGNPVAFAQLKDS
ncbi:MAG: type IV pili methyl-accepting chemotaxis transducer N-terminal domain-containing protein, partial [Thiobacillaceae bacterium]|nr:type IV pili methyl-accepting chemotaxis transducer N-terminal domain-containing protein [Thiobacillaceae bacterium]